MSRAPVLLAVACATMLSATAIGQPPPPPALANTLDPIPKGWTGPVFKLSKDFPTVLPTGDPKPWKAFDFKTQPDQYVRAVLAYCRDGNDAVDWAGQDNAVRKWYHAPGLVKGSNGREFIHGLTRERTSLPKELAPTQTDPWTNFAVGLYNPTAAYTLGRVWQNPDAPNPDGVKFEDGAVAVKLLFTTAPVAQVPFLADSKEWEGNVTLPGSNVRSPRTVRLLQVDVAVRDTRADSTTGWVFGTFMYQSDAAGATPYDRLVPVGLMWGNDPDLTPLKAAMGEKPKESWINPATKSPHVGWLGRLNGPVDNPNSSCLSCHARAGAPQTNDLVFDAMAADAEKMAYFTNVKAGEPYAAGVKSFDYSLQLGFGVRNFPGSGPPAPSPDAALSTSAPAGFNPRSGEVDPHHPADTKGPTGSRAPVIPEKREPPPPPPEEDWTSLWIACGIGVVLLVLAVGFYLMKRKPPPPTSAVLW